MKLSAKLWRADTLQSYNFDLIYDGRSVYPNNDGIITQEFGIHRNQVARPTASTPEGQVARDLCFWKKYQYMFARGFVRLVGEKDGGMGQNYECRLEEAKLSFEFEADRYQDCTESLDDFLLFIEGLEWK